MLHGSRAFGLPAFLERELNVPLLSRGGQHYTPVHLSQPPATLHDLLRMSVDPQIISISSEARIRAGSSQSLADIWSLRTSADLQGMPDAVVQPRNEEEVCAILRAACSGGFLVVPVGGRTSMISASENRFDKEERPVVALDMRGMKRTLWVSKDDRLACFEAGITGQALEEALVRSEASMVSFAVCIVYFVRHGMPAHPRRGHDHGPSARVLGIFNTGWMGRDAGQWSQAGPLWTLSSSCMKFGYCHHVHKVHEQSSVVCRKRFMM